jgi:hypothetical protein
MFSTLQGGAPTPRRRPGLDWPGGGPPPGSERLRRDPDLSTNPGHEGIQGELPGAGGVGCLHRPAELVDEVGAPEHALIPAIRLPGPAEGGDRGPAALGPQEPPALSSGRRP